MSTPNAKPPPMYKYPYQWWTWSTCALVVLLVAAVIWYLGTPLPLWGAIASGAITAMAGGQVIVIPTLALTRQTGKLPFHGEVHTATVLGFVERLVLFLACIVGHGPLAVGGWFAAKMVFQWKGWEESAPQEQGQGSSLEDHRPGAGRATFHVFLIGTALSITAAAGAAVMALSIVDKAELLQFRSLIDPPAKPVLGDAS